MFLGILLGGVMKVFFKKNLLKVMMLSLVVILIVCFLGLLF